MKKILISLLLLLFFVAACKEKTNENQAGKESTESKEISIEKYKKKGKVTYAVAMRETPDLDGKKVKCEESAEWSEKLDKQKGWECYSVCSRSTAYAPRGTEVDIVERTKEKLPVKKWNNYWYRVKVEGELYCDNPVWVFGEFVKLAK